MFAEESQCVFCLCFFFGFLEEGGVVNIFYVYISIVKNDVASEILLKLDKQLICLKFESEILKSHSFGIAYLNKNKQRK